MFEKYSTKNLEHKQFLMKSDVEDDGTFTGYASVFNNVDEGNDVVMPGAFTHWIRYVKDNPEYMTKVLYQHSWRDPIGLTMTMKEDDKGLEVSAFLNLDTQLGGETHSNLKKKVLNALSIGYFIEKSSKNEKEGIRNLEILGLPEFSVVTFGMNPLALVTSVKSNDEFFKNIEQAETARDFERLLRDTTFSNGQQEFKLHKDVAVKLAAKFGRYVKSESSNINI